MIKKIVRTIVTYILVLASLMVLGSLLGCKSSSTIVQERKDSIVIRHDTTRIVARDSVYLHDSVFVHTYTQGDTVYSIKERTIYKYKFNTDTIYKAKTDTIAKVVEKTTDGRKPDAEEGIITRVVVTLLFLLFAIPLAAVVWIKLK